MKLQQYAFIALSFLPLSINAQVEPIDIKAALSNDTILIGDRVEFTIRAAGKGKFSVFLPELYDTIPGGLYLMGKPTVDSSFKNDVSSFTFKLPVTAFNEGTFSVNNFAVLVRYSGSIDTLRVTSNSVVVNLVPHDSTLNDIKDIKPPIKEPVRFSEVAPWAGLGLLLVALAVLLYMYLRSRKQHKPFLNLFKPKDPPHVIALRELRALEEQKVWASSNNKLYYTKLIDILRNYLEGRFEISAPEQTTSEILSEIERLDFDFSLYIDTLRDLLYTSDLVKFAKHTASIEENHRFLKFAIDFVNGTKPVDYSANDEIQNSEPNKPVKPDSPDSLTNKPK